MKKNETYEFCVKLIHCGNVNVANSEDKQQKKVFFMLTRLFSLAECLRRGGFDVEIIHLDLEGSKGIHEILDFETVDAIGIDLHWVNQSVSVLETVELIKSIHPEIFLFLGGFTASLLAEQILADYSQLDAIIKGDGEMPIVELIGILSEEKRLGLGQAKQINPKKLAKVQNLVWREADGKVATNEITYVVTAEEMEKLDFAAIDLLRNFESYVMISRYMAFYSPISDSPLFWLEVGRGCEYACTFCGGNCLAQKQMNNRIKTVVRSIESIVFTIKKAISFGFKTFYTCLEFENCEEWFMELLKRIKEEDLEINYAYGSRKLPSFKLLDAISENCQYGIIEISPETWSYELRKKNKDLRLCYTNEELETCLDYIKTKTNVIAQLCFGYYLAYDTTETILKTIEYILRLLIQYPGKLEIQYPAFSLDSGSLFFFDPEKYDSEIRIRNFGAYVHNLNDNNLERKGQMADMTLFRPNDILREEDIKIQQKIRLLNYLFGAYRKSVSYIIGKTGIPDVIISVLKESTISVDSAHAFPAVEVKRLLRAVCNRHSLLDDTLVKLMEMEYKKIQFKAKISNPTTQLYLDHDYELETVPFVQKAKTGEKITKKEVTASQFIKEEKYWMNKLSGEIKKSFIPYDYNENNTKAYTPVEFKFKFTGDLFDKLMKLRNDSDPRLHMILVTGMFVLLNKVIEETDILIGAPCLKQKSDLKFVNTVLVLRTLIQDNMTFKKLLLEVRQTVVEAIKNQNYPVETLPHRLSIPYYEKDDFPLFDIAVLLKNIHDIKYLDHIRLNMIFSFFRTGECIEGIILYNSSLFNNWTIERIVGFYKQIFLISLDDIDIPVAEINILPEQERWKLLVEFNDTHQSFPGDKTLHELFTEQAKRSPGGMALVGNGHWAVGKKEKIYVTYGELNEKVIGLACLLWGKGVQPGIIVGIMASHTIDMIIGILAIMKAGGVYLPLDPDYPGERIDYMLKDSNAAILLTEKSKEINGIEVVPLCELSGESLYRHTHLIHAKQLCYIIYTSGTTGKSKGVLVEHRSIINFVYWKIRQFNYTERDICFQMILLSFDAFCSNFYPGILVGARVIMADYERLLESDYMINLIEKEGVTNFSIVPSVYKLLLENSQGHEFNSIRFIVLGGETASPALLAANEQQFPGIQVINEYGPTETTVAATSYFNMTQEKNTVIGRPIYNTRIYILDGKHRLQPIRIAGQLCINGAGLCAGYLNNIELTREKFVENHFLPGEIMYKTGDLAWWLPDGNIEYLGRIDQQVKIRGFRIELAEIEAQLSGYNKIKDVVVIDRQEENEEKYLCAYIVGEVDSGELKDYLSHRIPGYMIPSFFIPVDEIPLTRSGKLDRKALPAPGIIAEVNWAPPQDEIEEVLAEVWSEVLKIDKNDIGIDYSFFNLGGHSLRATVLISKLHKALDVKIPLAQVFETPTIRTLGEYIKESSRDKYIPIDPIEMREYYELSYAQKRLWLIHQLEENPVAYNIPSKYVFEKLNPEVFQKALEDIVRRHEMLRTTFITVEGEPKQVIHDNKSFAFRIRQIALKEEQNAGDIAWKMAKEEAITPFSLEKGPLLRGTLLQIDNMQYVFFMVIHHIVSDAWSMDILLKEVLALYNAYAIDQKYSLSPLRIQYKDYAKWQNKQLMKEDAKSLEAYWLNRFQGEISLLELPTDYPRPKLKSHSGDSLTFPLTDEVSVELRRIAKEARASLFMTLLTAVNIFLHRLTGQKDIIVGTHSNGRGHRDLHEQVGFYVNMLPLRNKINKRESFRDLLNNVKQNTLEAYKHQEYPFSLLVDRLNIPRDMSRNPIFDVVVTALTPMDPKNTQKSDPMEEHNLLIQDEDSHWVSKFQFNSTSSKYDLRIRFTDLGSQIFVDIQYNSDLFKRKRILVIKERFICLMEDIVKDIDKAVDDFTWIIHKEKYQWENKFMGGF